MSTARSATQLLFNAPRSIILNEIDLPELGPADVCVKARLSAPSAGTELLLYRDQWPKELPLDPTIPSLAHPPTFPLSYGYASVGEIEAVGTEVDQSMIGQRVFAFHPHQSRIVLPFSQLKLIPENVTDPQACLYPNLETALSLVMDTHPLIGERGVVLGQGIVGLLVSALLLQYPLKNLSIVDGYASRRFAAQSLVSDDHSIMTNFSLEDLDELCRKLMMDEGNAQSEKERFDFCIEVSGQPIALESALTLTRRYGRIILGSWYGTKTHPIRLGGRFHRAHQRLISSQVSMIKPEHSGWDYARRGDEVWRWLAQLDLGQLLEERIPFSEAPALYARLDQNPSEMIQPLLRYS